MENHTQVCIDVHVRRKRQGRALVECIVASMLLSVVALAVATTTRGSLALIADSALVSHAQALSSARAEAIQSGVCVASANGTNNAPGVDVSWQQSNAGAQTSVQVDVAITRSPIAFRHSAAMLSMRSARNCQ